MKYILSRKGYYDAVTARFLSEDTYRGQANDPLSLNLYTYCHNNPIKYTDPTGHWAKGDEGLNDKAKAKIVALGNAWSAAKTKEERDKIHQDALAIRAAHEKDSKGNYVKKDTLVEIKNVDSFDKAMIAAMADGKLTQAEDKAAQALIGAKITTYSFNSQSNPSIPISTTTTITTTTIGKADIDVKTTVTKVKATNQITSVGLENKITTHYSAYVFYLPEWKDEMVDIKHQLDSYFEGEIDEDDIGTASITNASELKNAWNSMGKTSEGGSIKAVVINSHANNSELAFEAGQQNLNASDISNLQNKDVERLILLGCNAGHIDNKNNTPGENFSKKINGGLVLSSDGTVFSGWGMRQYIFWGSYVFNSWNDKHFKNQRPVGSSRDNEGFKIYQYNNGQICISSSLGKSLNIQQMLFLMDKERTLK